MSVEHDTITKHTYRCELGRIECVDGTLEVSIHVYSHVKATPDNIRELATVLNDTAISVEACML